MFVRLFFELIVSMRFGLGLHEPHNSDPLARRIPVALRVLSNVPLDFLLYHTKVRLQVPVLKPWLAISLIDLAANLGT